MEVVTKNTKGIVFVFLKSQNFSFICFWLCELFFLFFLPTFLICQRKFAVEKKNWQSFLALPTFFLLKFFFLTGITFVAKYFYAIYVIEQKRICLFLFFLGGGGQHFLLANIYLAKQTLRQKKILAKKSLQKSSKLKNKNKKVSLHANIRRM